MRKIEGKLLSEALRRIVERTPMITDWRKASNGKVVRFFIWKA